MVSRSLLTPLAVLGMIEAAWLGMIPRTWLATTVKAATSGFVDHGVAVPFSTHRGVVATEGKPGEALVLIWLYDHRGCYGLLIVEAESGRSEELPTPFPWGGDAPYASLLSSRGKLYTHFGSHFVEFDPQTRAFTFVHKTAPQMAMSLTEDDRGIIWSATYPQCGLASYDPATGTFRDHGHLHRENWAQYPRFIACDIAGWVYFAIGYTKSHILGFNPADGQLVPMIPEEERQQGMAQVFRATDGFVYGQPLEDKNADWYRFFKGTAEKIGQLPSNVRPKEIVAGSQGLFHPELPNGRRIKNLDLATRQLTIEDPRTQESKTVQFDYSSEGGHIMGMALAPNGTVCGGTAFPFWFFSYDPKTSRWERHPCYRQWNSVARQGDRFFVGGYPQGFLLEWDPQAPWRETIEGNEDSNPRFLVDAQPDIYRPHELLAHPDGNLLVLGGTPAYGHTGGGLLFWDRKKQSGTILRHTEILEYHSTMSLVALPEGKLLGGTTVAAGTGGEQKASQAELYLLDLQTKKVEWHAPVLSQAWEYTDLYFDRETNLVYGIANRTRFFVFNPARKELLRQEDISRTLGPCVYHQGPRVFVTGPDGKVFMLLAQGIASIDRQSFKVSFLARSPVTITAGGDFYEGRIYFASGSHLWSWSPNTP